MLFLSVRFSHALIISINKFLSSMKKQIEIYHNKSLKDFCTFKIGGSAKLLFVVYSIRQLKLSICYCLDNKLKFKVIGCGANLLFDDNGFDGAIIVNRCSRCFLISNRILVESGLSIAELINISANKGLSGIEFFAGIPSTIGGATVNNLGAWNHEISSCINSVYGFFAKSSNKNKAFKTIKLTQSQCEFGYRFSKFKGEDFSDFIITKIKLTLEKSTKSTILNNIKTALNKKCSTQPTDKPSAGSIFKRTDVIPAKLIDDAGLKGTKIGDAEISTKHAGFIINLGKATSKDVKDLITHIQNEIYAKYSATLTREIEYVDF